MSRIYEPYRALGLCASDISFVIKYSKHSNVYYVVVPVGERFNVYKVASKLDFSNKSFHITVVFHPYQYKNKVLFGSAEGPLQLWNVLHQKQLYWFKGFGASVTCIQQAPAIDVCAIGLANGSIVLHNLKYDTKLLDFNQDGGAITAIDFRIGVHSLRNASNMGEEMSLELLSTNDEDIYMVTGSESGLVSCWQLYDQGKSRPVGQSRYIHWGRVVSIYTVPGGDASGAIVTTGGDNCIKVSFFDRPDGGPRTEYRRAGHMESPNRILFWPGSSAGGSLLVSAGQDSLLRIFSTFNQTLDKSMGKAYAPGAPDRRKATGEQRSAWLLPGVIQMDACSTRAEAWDSLVAVHENRRQVTTWNFMNATRGRHWLDPEKFQGSAGEARRLFKHTYATCVHMTNCGNFVLIGYSNGDIYKFNIQSGLERGSYGDPRAHDQSIVGVYVNEVNRLTVSVGGSQVRFWSFYKHDLLDSLELPNSIQLSKFNRENDLLAVALSTATIVLIDLTHRKIIRRFWNPENQPCVDMAMSSDGRWLISAHHGDPLIRTWDIVDSKLLDCFRVQLPITSIAFSLANEFLATTHANSLGVYLWSNRATYKRLYLQPLPVDYLPSTEENPVCLPTRSMITTFNEEGVKLGIRDPDELLTEMDENDGDQKAVVEEYTYISPNQIHGQLATLCGLPSSYFQTLMNLDLIRARNRKLVVNPSNNRDLSKLPFFLPVIETAKGLVWLDTADEAPPTKDGGDNTATSPTDCKRKRSGLLDLAGDGLCAIEPVTGLSAKFKQATRLDEFDRLMNVLKTLGPSELDLEIRLLIPSTHLTGQNSILSGDDNEQVQCLMKDSNDRLNGFLRLLINRFEHNLDVDFACACLELLLQRHGDVLLDNVQNECTDKSMLLSDQQCLSMDTDDNEQGSGTWCLIRQAVIAKTKAQKMLTERLTRSICLVDFIRNPITGLHF